MGPKERTIETQGGLKEKVCCSWAFLRRLQHTEINTQPALLSSSIIFATFNLVANISFTQHFFPSNKIDQPEIKTQSHRIILPR